MYFSTVFALLCATTAMAAPAPRVPVEVYEAMGDLTTEVTARAVTCNSSLNLFTNPGFNGTGSPWSGSGSAGTKGVVQTAHFPIDFPMYGGPSAYAINMNITKGQTVTFTLQQTVAAIQNNGNYKMGLNSWLAGTASAICVQSWFAGSLDTTLLSSMPKPQAEPTTAFYNAKNVAVDSYVDSGATPKAGFWWECSASNTEDAKLTIYVDNANLTAVC